MVQNNITGIVLFGGGGTRLLPLTEVINKHLLPVYNRTMAQHAIEFLINSGITNIMISANSSDIKIYKTLNDENINTICWHRWRIGIVG